MSKSRHKHKNKARRNIASATLPEPTAAAASATSTETGLVLYQKGILDPLELSDEHKSVIEAIENGLYASVKFKKLKGSENIYYARKRGKDISEGKDKKGKIKGCRLLFTFERGYLVLIGVIPNHDFNKCALLKVGGLEQFLIKNKCKIDALIEESPAATASTSAAAVPLAAAAPFPKVILAMKMMIVTLVMLM